MATKILLLYGKEEPLADLQLVLEKQHVGTMRAQTCAEALRILNTDDSPSVVFTALTVSDGSWEDALRLASQTKRPVDFIIVSHFIDVHLYTTAMGNGAFDFMVPPFLDAEIAHVVRRASDDVESRANTQVQTALA